MENDVGSSWSSENRIDGKRRDDGQEEEYLFFIYVYDESSNQTILVFLYLFPQSDARRDDSRKG